jgi:hypothetical protein
LVAAFAFVMFAVIVLLRKTALLEPDDYAYRASIVALRHGHILLTNSQYAALNRQLSMGTNPGVLQWHHMTSGKWISEKNPGYPFFAVPFYLVGLLRLAPLCYGASACVGLYAGAKKWLGGWSGTYAVCLYCFSGAALTFAWRDTMPSFSDASLIAAGFGTLLWVMLATAHSARRRCLVGIVGFLALEGAVFIRYTNVVELMVAVIAVLVLARSSRVTWSSVAVWLSTVVLFGLGVLAFDRWAYGKATSTGYANGEISFSFSSFWANLKGMPRYLTTSMPLWIVAALGAVWLLVRYVRHRTSDDSLSDSTRRDAVVGLVLAVAWLGLWFLYLNYTWTVSQVSGAGIGAGSLTVHVIRFYLPALGPLALLATWTLTRMTKPIAWPLLGVIVISALLSFNNMASTNAGGIGPGHHPGSGPSGSFSPGKPPPNGSGPYGPPRRSPSH